MSYPGYPQQQQGYPGAHGPPMQPSFPGVPQQQSQYPGSPGQGYAPPPGPPPQGFQQPPSGVQTTETSGNVEGVQYRIAHRDSNSLLSLRLPPGVEVKGKPGSMVAMDASVRIKGKVSLRGANLAW